MKQRDLEALFAAHSLALKRVACLLDSMASLLDRAADGVPPVAEPGVVANVVGEVTSAIARLHPFESHSLPTSADDIATRRMAIPDHLIAELASPERVARAASDAVTRKMGSVPPGVPATHTTPRRHKSRRK